MEMAAGDLEFERAAAVRDRLRGLTFVQGSSVINPATVVDADVIAAWQIAGSTCVQVFFIRGGRNNGNREFYPSHAKGEALPHILSAFIAQFYDDKPPPPLLLVNELPAEKDLVSEALTMKSERKVDIIRPLRGEKHEVVRHAENNAREALERKLAEAAGQRQVLQGVAERLNLAGPPKRIEVYDNSHIMGTNPYGVMVVAGPDGLIKQAYRKYQIRGPMAAGDDLAMMREMLRRRFARALKEQSPGETAAEWPDLLLVDGGAGQLAAVHEILEDLGVLGVKIVAISKGPDRNAGREWLHIDGLEPFQLPPQDPVLYFLQRLRDEAHRFAITTHRASRSKAIQQSELDSIEGVGPARKRALLNHFGSARGVKMAGFADLEAAPGINHETARRVYAHFHPGTRLNAET
jgi:excinuclease ABC subunit C